MDNVFAYVSMAAISLPLSFFLARGCLRGVMRLVCGPTMNGVTRRNVL
jgi:hypothetical protein